MTLPVTPRSLPLMTMTRSPFLIFIAMSEHLRRQRDDSHEPLLAQLAADRAEDARAAGVAAVADQDGGVLVETDVGAVRATALLGGAHDDGLDDLALLDVAARDGVLDGRHDDVPDAGVAPAGAAQHPDAQQLLGTGVVGDPKSRLLLDHFAFSRISTTRQRLVAESGRVSMSRTRSPTPQVFCSSWALRLLVRRMTLP